MGETKTTFYLSDALRVQLKAVGAEHGKTMTELLSEGALHIVERYRARGDQQELARRARKARDKLRRGLYSGPSVSDGVDEIVYGGSTGPLKAK